MFCQILNGRTDGWTDNMCKNKNHYRSWLWLVDIFQSYIYIDALEIWVHTRLKTAINELGKENFCYFANFLVIVNTSVCSLRNIPCCSYKIITYFKASPVRSSIWFSLLTTVTVTFQCCTHTLQLSALLSTIIFNDFLLRYFSLLGNKHKPILHTRLCFWPCKLSRTSLYLTLVFEQSYTLEMILIVCRHQFGILVNFYMKLLRSFETLQTNKVHEKSSNHFTNASTTYFDSIAK